MSAWQYRRVSVTPGKHGGVDKRVAIGEVVPTLSELAVMVAAVFRAEDRYDKPGQQGRVMFRDVLDKMFWAESFEEVEKIAEEVAHSVNAGGHPCAFTS